jgi:membrane-associated phospholipid phosphatase
VQRLQNPGFFAGKPGVLPEFPFLTPVCFAKSARYGYGKVTGGPINWGRRVVRAIIKGMARVHLVLVLLAFTIVISPPQVRRYGDNLQIALPLIAWGCSALNGNGAEFALRFTGMFLVAHGSKRILGDLPINQRPGGSGHGFPSAHTAAASLGASSLVHDCIVGNPVAKVLVIMSAGFVGASRIEVRAHDIWQVLAGALLGWGSDRILRHDRKKRAAVRRAFARIGAAIRGGFGLLGSKPGGPGNS